MASRTQIVCLCEGRKGGSIDEVFIYALMNALRPGWLRQQGSNIVRMVPCGGRNAVVKKMPEELKSCRAAGANTTLMVWADLDDNRDNGDALKADFWQEAQRNGINKDDFDRTVFIFAKDRLENWIEFLQTGNTDEFKEGLRVKHNRTVADAARTLADICKGRKSADGMPPSLEWSCRNWRALVDRMR